MFTRMNSVMTIFFPYDTAYRVGYSFNKVCDVNNLMCDRMITITNKSSDLLHRHIRLQNPEDRDVIQNGDVAPRRNRYYL